MIKYLMVFIATFSVSKIMISRNIKLVFATGGYISVPSIIAAKILNIPIIIHESNLIPGLATKYFGRYCNFVLTGFKETASYLKGCNIVFTGTPLRHQFYIDHLQSSLYHLKLYYIHKNFEISTFESYTKHCWV